MAYFPNGTAGECYLLSYCFNCKNWRKKKGENVAGCPVWDLHILYSYELCNSKSKAKEMLDFLIPEDKDDATINHFGRYMPTKCSMFLKKRLAGECDTNISGQRGEKA